jgi:hypothetical protein
VLKQEREYYEKNIIRREDNIKMEIGGTEWSGVYWINLAQDRDYRDRLCGLVVRVHTQ